MTREFTELLLPVDDQVDPEVLKDIGRRFGGRLALNAGVLRPGVVRVGDDVRLVRAAGAGSRAGPDPTQG